MRSTTSIIAVSRASLAVAGVAPGMIATGAKRAFVSRFPGSAPVRAGGKNYIETVWGRGYVLREPLESEAKIPA